METKVSYPVCGQLSPVLLHRFVCQELFSFASASPLLPSLLHCINRKQPRYSIYLGTELFTFLFLHWQKELCFHFQRYGAAIQPRRALPNRQRLLKSGCRNAHCVFRIVGVARNARFCFILTISGLSFCMKKGVSQTVLS